MLKRIALAVMASSLLFACGGEESSGDDECVLDEAAVCAGKQCGNVSAQDSCGEMKTVSCGTCTDGTTCQANMCISDTQPTCELSDEEKAAKCEGKCGTISVMDHCETIIDLDCGTDICGDGQVCHATENRCMDESECAMSDDEKLAYCAGNVCGAAKVQDHCGNSDYVDCADASAPMDPLKDFETAKDENGDYKGSVYWWDENGTYKIAIVEGMADGYLVYLIYKNDPASFGSPIALSSIGTDAEGYFECYEDACMLILNGNDPGYYYYTPISGTVTINADEDYFEISDANFSDMIMSDCYSSKIDFNIIEPPVDCTAVEPLAEFESALNNDNAYATETSLWDYSYYVTYANTESSGMSLIFKASAKGSTQNISVAKFDDDGYPYCTDNACLVMFSDYEYVANGGTVTISEDMSTFELSDVTFMVNEECTTATAVDFTLVTDPPELIDCTALTPLDVFASALNTDGDYSAELDEWDTTHFVSYIETKDDALYLLINYEASPDVPLTISTALFDDDGYPYCSVDACLVMFSGKHFYIANGGTVTVSEDSNSYQFQLTDVTFEVSAQCTTTAIDLDMIAELPTTPAE